MKRSNALHSKNDLNKYQQIIAPSWGRRISGSAPTIQTRNKVGRGNITLMKVNNYPFEKKYFDDYNEIVDRFKLLHASEVAGNNAHNNVIISIIEELKGAKIMK